MFASTQDPEFVQGQSRDVPNRELGPNIYTTKYLTVETCGVRFFTDMLFMEAIRSHEYSS